MVSDAEIELAISRSGFTGRTVDECRLCLVELLIKAQAGCRNGHTEESFLACFNLMKKDRAPNWLGRKFIMSMFYASSNNRPASYKLMEEYRK